MYSIVSPFVWRGKRVALRAWTYVLLSLFVSASASAEDDRERARKAYDRGVVAHKQGAYARAANEFALADTLAPSPVALRAALDASVKADDPVLGMELVARSSRVSPLSAELRTSVEAAKTSFVGRTGTMTLRCNEGAPCEASVDGATLTAEKGRIVRVGEHAVVVRARGAEETRSVRVGPDERVELRPSNASPAAPSGPAAVVPAAVSTPTSAPAPSSSSAPATSAPSSGPETGRAAGPDHADRADRVVVGGKGLPPVVLVIGAGLTAVAGGLSVWSGLDTKSTHDDFSTQRCATQRSTTCDDLASSGKGAETRSNVLFVTTGVLGVATLATAIFFVDYGGSKSMASAPAQGLRVVPAIGSNAGEIRVFGAF